MAFKIGQKAAGQIAAVVRAFEGEVKGDGKNGGRRNLFGQSLMEAILTESLDSASDPLDGATCCTAQVLRGTGPLFEEQCEQELAVSDEFITIVNRSIDLSLDAGTYVIVGWINGEWRIIWADCSAADVSFSTSDEGGGGDDGGDGGTLGDGGLGE